MTKKIATDLMNEFKSSISHLDGYSVRLHRICTGFYQIRISCTDNSQCISSVVLQYAYKFSQFVLNSEFCCRVHVSFVTSELVIDL